MLQSICCFTFSSEMHSQLLYTKSLSLPSFSSPLSRTLAVSCSHRSFSSSMFIHHQVMLYLVAKVFCIWQFFLTSIAFFWPPCSILAISVNLLMVPSLLCSLCQFSCPSHPQFLPISYLYEQYSGVATLLPVWLKTSQGLLLTTTFLFPPLLMGFWYLLWGFWTELPLFLTFPQILEGSLIYFLTFIYQVPPTEKQVL